LTKTSKTLSCTVSCCSSVTGRSLELRWILRVVAAVVLVLPGRSPAETVQYSHDSMQRLTRVTHPDGTTMDYVYDALGNRLMKTTTLPGAPSNQPPAAVTTPGIADGLTNASTTAMLSWSPAVDPDSGDSVVYFVYFGTTIPPPLVFSGWATNWSPQGNLHGFTTYYWQVVARDSHNAGTAGPIWSFTTGSQPPVADFVGSPAKGFAPLLVNFSDQSFDTDNAIVSWQWDFDGNGTVDSTNRNPATAYTIPGDYTVALTVADETGATNTTVKTNFLIVADQNNVDLVALGLSVESAGSFRHLTINYAVTNQGAFSLSGQWQWADACYLSTDAVLDGLDTQVGVFYEDQTLFPGAAYTRTNVVTIPDVAAQDFYLLFKSDANDQIEESSEANNMGAVPLSGYLPDLACGDLTWTGDQISGEQISVVYSVTNLGALALGTDASWHDRLYLSTNAMWDVSDTELANWALGGSLLSGASYTRTNVVTLPLSPVGSCYLILRVDNENTLVEGDESNDASTNNPIEIAIGPDLVMSAVSGPAAASPGGVMIVTNTVQNAGVGATGSGYFFVGFYLSSDATVTTNDQFIGYRWVFSGLSPGQSDTKSTSLTLSASLPTGTYYLGAIADSSNGYSPGNRIPESNETNNTLTGNLVEIRAGIDLAVTQVGGPTNAVTGGTILLTNVVANLGIDGAGGSVVRLYLSTNSTIETTDLLLGSRSVGNLNPGQSSSNSTSVTIPVNVGAGTYYLGAIADYNDAIPESSETNNALVGNAIEIAIGPDLVMTALSGPNVASPGGAIMLLNTLENIGSGGTAYNYFVVGFYLSIDVNISTNDQLIGYRGFTFDLAAGESSTKITSLNLPVSVPVGTYYLGAIADDGFAYPYGDGIPESNEANNTLAGNPIEIRVGIDLTVTEVAGPTNGVTGEAITLTNVVANLGTDAAGSSTVRFYLSSNNIIETTDLLLGSRSTGTLNGDQSSSNNTSITIPVSVPAATYYLGAIADYDDAIPESSETNNALAGNLMEIAIGPDLVMTVLSGPPMGSPSGTVKLTNIVQNIGSGSTAGGYFYLGFYLSSDAVISTNDDQLIGSQPVFSSLATGQSRSNNTSVTIPAIVPAGTYYLGAIADDGFAYPYGGGIPEAIETNNTLAGTLIEIQAGIDLAVTQVVGPTNAVTGETISVTNGVTNLGNDGAGSSILRLYLSTNNIIETTDRLLGSRLVSALGPGQSSSNSTSVTIPVNVGAGTYYLGAIADYSNLIPESDETNNALAGEMMEIAIGPDLVMAALSGPSVGSSGGVLTLTNTVQNIGTGGTVHSYFAIGFYLSVDASISVADQFLGNQAVLADLPPGQSATNKSSLTVPISVPAGTYYLGAIADYSSLLAESDETNNDLAGSMIQIVIGPDLVMTALAGPSAALPGGALMQTNTVQNIGTGGTASTYFTIGFYLSSDANISTNDQFIGYQNVFGDLAPAQSRTNTSLINLPVSLPAGGYYLGAIADSSDGYSSGNRIPESNETNNALAGNLIEILGPVPRIVSLQLVSNDVWLGFTTLQGHGYRAESTTNLLVPITWVPVEGVTNVAGNDSVIIVVDPEAATGTEMYYRVVRLP